MTYHFLTKGNKKQQINLSRKNLLSLLITRPINFITIYSKLVIYYSLVNKLITLNTKILEIPAIREKVIYYVPLRIKKNIHHCF